MVKPEIHTLAELKKSGYRPKSIRQEIRSNLLKSLKENTPVFPGILGYEHTVIPDVERALLAGHNINFLGLRGQAKTRLARQMVNLLDEWVPVISGSELNEDPLNPISNLSRLLLLEKGDETPVDWLHRSNRYAEKLATPDVTVADLIGDVDPIKAANLRISYSDERAIHFGMIPRSNRCIFVINELPDLQPRIQVALFNILQEGDIQIRGFQLRIPLDMQFIFTANPEDYTNRGSIVTPLKDRIGSQILTHYPKDLETGMRITRQEARLSEEQKNAIVAPDFIFRLMETISFSARESEFVDQKSGVSARMGIGVYEAVMAGAERRMVISGDESTCIRVADIYSAIPAINGKVEMVYEGEQEGPYNVAVNLIIQSIRKEFEKHFPVEEKKRKGDKKPLDPYREITRWFASGHALILPADMKDSDYAKALSEVPGLADMVEKQLPNLGPAEKFTAMELLLHGLAAMSKISVRTLNKEVHFSDLLGSIFNGAEGVDGDEF
jgi:magnesium chelatase subunit I